MGGVGGRDGLLFSGLNRGNWDGGERAGREGGCGNGRGEHDLTIPIHNVEECRVAEERREA